MDKVTAFLIDYILTNPGSNLIIPKKIIYSSRWHSVLALLCSRGLDLLRPQ